MKRLTKIGNSQGIIIDKPILDLLGITPETDLTVRTDGQALMIIPTARARRSGKDREAAFRAALGRTMKNHRKTLEKLAK